MVVEEVMTPHPYCVEESDDIRTALSIMLDHDVRHVPVVNGRRLIGVVTDRDIRDYSVPCDYDGADRRDQRVLLTGAVLTIMDAGVTSVAPLTEVAEVIDLLLELRLDAVLVVEPESKELRGIVSYVDILAAARGSC